MTPAGAGATASVACGAATHTVAVQDGRLVALDHPTPDRERTLISLGGDPVPCIELLDAWERHADDLEVLILASRGPGDELAPTERPAWRGSRPGARTARRGGSPAKALSRALTGRFGPVPGRVTLPDEPSRSGVEIVLCLGGGIPHALVAGVLTTWWRRLAEQPDDPEVVAALPQLRAATYGRARVALRNWSGRRDLDVRVVDERVPTSVTRDDGRLAVRVPLTWLPEVWLPGLATVAGLFCLSADADGPGHWRIHGIDRNFETLEVGIAVR